MGKFRLKRWSRHKVRWFTRLSQGSTGVLHGSTPGAAVVQTQNFLVTIHRAVVKIRCAAVQIHRAVDKIRRALVPAPRPRVKIHRVQVQAQSVAVQTHHPWVKMHRARALLELSRIEIH